MTNGLAKRRMLGASIAECVLALFVFVGLAICVPILEERGLVDAVPDQIESAPVEEAPAAPVHVATDDLDHSNSDRIEMAAAHTPHSLDVAALN